MSNIFIGLKKTCVGVLEREDRNKDNEASLKERGVIEMSTTVRSASITRCSHSLNTHHELTSIIRTIAMIRSVEPIFLHWIWKRQQLCKHVNVR